MHVPSRSAHLRNVFLGFLWLLCATHPLFRMTSMRTLSATCRSVPSSLRVPHSLRGSRSRMFTSTMISMSGRKVDRLDESPSCATRICESTQNG
jgi:hypothetical protein